MNTLFGCITANDKVATSAFITDAKRANPKRLANIGTTTGNGYEIAGDFSSSSANVAGIDEFYLVGEIYNRQEIANAIGNNTGNDATLIHHLIRKNGHAGVRMLNGQFLIIHISHTEGKARLTSDHLGIMQLLYHWTGTELIVGTEVHLMYYHPSCPKGVDWDAALRRLEPNFAIDLSSDYSTWFKGISLMPGGTSFEIDLASGILSSTAYWAPQQFSPDVDDTRTAADVIGEYATLFKDAVKIRMENNGPTHSLMSGGLDSSAICGIAARQGMLESYSIINQTTVLEGTTGFCNSMSREMGFENHQFLVRYKELCFDRELWKQRVWRAESPVNHTDSLTKTMLHHAIHLSNPHTRNILSGTGSDQLNGGLIHYMVPDEGDNVQKWEAFKNALIEQEQKNFIARKDEQLWQMRNLVNQNFLAQCVNSTAQQNPMQLYMQGALLSEAFSLIWDEQRASSSHRHNTRYPFLDKRIAEFTAMIPPRLHQELFCDKEILRKAAVDFVPDYIINKPKKPYELQEYDFRVEMYEYLTADGPESLFTQAFGEIDTPHPAINKKALYDRIVSLRSEPKIIDWLHVMHIINVGLLDKLAEQDEAALNYEVKLGPPERIDFSDLPAAMQYLNSKLEITSMDTRLARPLKFSDDCSIHLDLRKNKYYLSKQNVLLYELEDDPQDWRIFLTNIDGVTSCKDILIKTGIEFAAIEDYFMLSIKERILATDNKRIGY